MRAVPALAAMLLLAGCGGGGEPAATARPSVDRLAQLDRYLDRMEGRERRFERLVERVRTSFGGIDGTSPGPAWARAAERLAPVGVALDELGTQLGSIGPPRALAAAHRRLAEATLAFRDYVGGVEQALRAGVPATLATAASQDTSAIRDARVAWRRAVARYCWDVGTAPPEWMVPSPAA